MGNKKKPHDLIGDSFVHGKNGKNEWFDLRFLGCSFPSINRFFFISLRRLCTKKRMSLGDPVGVSTSPQHSSVLPEKLWRLCERRQ